MTIGALELECIAAAGWPGLRCEWRGGWLLRAGGGWTGRANSALPLREDGTDLDALLAHVVAWYTHHELPPTIQVPLPARDDLRDQLEARGWSARWGAVVLTATVPAVLVAVPARGDLPPVVTADAPDDAWMSAYHYRGGALPAVARDVLAAGARPRFLRVVEGDTTVAICRTATHEDWVGLTAVEVVAQHRRRGLATHLLRAALEQARDDGVDRAYLQTEDTNIAALALYGRAGFSEHHSYQYFRPDGVA